MIDTHCHIDASAFDKDRHEVIETAFANGVEAIIIPAIEPSRFESVLRLAQSDSRIFCGIGVHPHHAAEVSESDITLVETLCQSSPRVVAVGEIGLDYHYDFAPRDVQQHIFRQQLRIAKRLNLPVIIHNRESDEDMFRILQEEQDGTLQGVLHCFSGTIEQAHQAFALNMKVSFTGNITFVKNILPDTVAQLPPNSFMIETDAPYMTPKPYRGNRNQPQNVRFVAEKIAELQSKTFEEIITMTSNTAKELFRLSFALILAICLGTTTASAESFSVIEPTTNTSSDVAKIATPTNQDDEEEDEEDVHPYPKTFGIAPLIGSNTIILSDGERNPSLDGLFALGGAVSYNFTDNFFTSLSYVYSKDNSLVDIGRAAEPNIFQMVDAGLWYTPNPYNRINFYFTVGASVFFNNLAGTTEQTRTGINGGIGLIVNVDTPYGVFAPTIEWRYSAVLGERIVPNANGDLAKIGFQASLPKLMLFFYPSF